MSDSVSIVIVSHNRRALLVRCLESCREQDYPDLQIVVVLNPAEPGQAEEIAARFPDVRVVRTHVNLGFFPALNIAIANADGDYVMTVDDDSYFLDRRLLRRFVDAFRDDPRLAVATCTIEGPHEAPAEPRDRYVHLFKTGFAMLPRRLFADPELVGYYPDVFFRSAGETYVCTRSWDLGLRVRQLAVAGMYHDQTMQGRSRRDWGFFSLRSQILCVLMREPWAWAAAHLASMFPRSFWFYAVKMRQPLVWAHAWASACGHGSEALRLRRPARWETMSLLRRLRTETVVDVETLQ